MTNVVTTTFVPGFRLIDGTDLNSVATEVNNALNGTTTVAINGTVGATTPNTGAFTSLTSSANTRRSTDSGVTAHAGGGRANAYAITKDITEVATVGSAADSVVLPASVAGMEMIVINDGANSMQVFANGTDTIDGTAGATGVAQAAAAKVQYTCYASGLWVSFKSA